MNRLEEINQEIEGLNEAKKRLQDQARKILDRKFQLIEERDGMKNGN